MKREDTVVRVRDVVNRFGTQVVHDGVSFDVLPGEIFGIVGGSGSGKSVLLRTLLGLQHPDAGTVVIEGHELTSMGDRALRDVKRRYGVTFQHGALFTSLTVAERRSYHPVNASPQTEQTHGMKRRAAKPLLSRTGEPQLKPPLVESTT